MRLCFIVEECYRGDSMPLAVVRQLVEWGHHVDVFEPGRGVARISELAREGDYDAWVLKTVSGGPGLSVLEAAAASGLTTVNDANAIRLVRDKAVAAAVARRAGLASPLTYFAAAHVLLRQIPADHYPLVVKPTFGNSGRAVHLVTEPGQLRTLAGPLADQGFLIAQPYVANPGVDVKVYSVAGELHATIRRSPLHPDVTIRCGTTALTAELARVAAAVGEVFGLDLYGVDLVEGPEGWVVVDVNDFPSFRQVPNAVPRVARSVLRLAESDRSQRTSAALVAAAPTGAPAGATVAASLGTPAESEDDVARWRPLVPAAEETEIGWRV